MLPLFCSSTLILLTGAGPVRYLAIGDSFTAGTGAEDEENENFAIRLTMRWRKAGREVDYENRAVNGATSQDVLKRQLDGVRAFKPTIVTLLIGANDLVRGSAIGTYRAQLRRILQKLQDEGVALKNVCLLPQPLWTQSPTGGHFGKTDADILAWNVVVKEVAVANETCFVDLSPLMAQQAKDAKWARDGLHGSAEVYDAWAEKIFRSQTPVDSRTLPSK